MNSIEDTAQQFDISVPFKKGLTQVLNSIRSIQMFLDKHRQQQVVQPNKAVEQQHNYNFTGQHTDIAFCDTNGSISYEEISNISDYKLKDNVTTSFNNAVEDGYLSYENASYTLTDKGKEHINSQSFIEQFEKDQKIILLIINYKIQLQLIFKVMVMTLKFFSMLIKLTLIN